MVLTSDERPVADPRMRIRLHVRRVVESKNRFLGKFGKGVQFSYHRYKKEVQRFVTEALIAGGQWRRIQPMAAAHIIIIAWRARLLDPDNLEVKPWIDALRYAQVIVDDTPDRITLEIKQRKTKHRRDQFTTVEVWRPKPETPDEVER